MVQVFGGFSLNVTFWLLGLARGQDGEHLDDFELPDDEGPGLCALRSCCPSMYTDIKFSGKQHTNSVKITLLAMTFGHQMFLLWKVIIDWSIILSARPYPWVPLNLSLWPGPPSSNLKKTRKPFCLGISTNWCLAAPQGCILILNKPSWWGKQNKFWWWSHPSFLCITLSMRWWLGGCRFQNPPTTQNRREKTKGSSVIDCLACTHLPYW